MFFCGLLQKRVLKQVLFFSDGCDPLVYRVLDDHRRSVMYSAPASLESSYIEDLLCDDVLPFGWYRFLAYGM
jgi:hypothetical protein